MSADRLLVSFVGVALTATLLAALVLRKRYRSCLSFFLYVIAVLVPSFLFAVWRARFYTWENYFLQEIVHNLLKFAIALELGYRTFRAFPAALAQARRIVFVILAFVAVVAAVGTTTTGPSSAVIVEWHARVLNGTIWLLTGIAAVILWYRLPVDPFHKAILVGFVPYLLLFSIGMRAMLEMGQTPSSLLQRAPAIAYLVLLAYWNRAAWASVPAYALAPQAARARPLEQAERSA